MRSPVEKHLMEHRMWYAGAVIVLAILILLGYFVFNIREKQTDLSVEEVFFTTSEELGGSDTNLKIVVFLTNDGKSEINEVKVRAFAIERDSNLARAEDTVVIGKIEGKTTEEGELFISVPNNDSYRIELLVFEEAKLTIRGSGTVDLTGIGVASDYRNYDDDDEKDGLSTGTAGLDEGSAGFIFTAICALMIPVVIIIIVVVAVVKAQNKEKKTHEDDTFFQERRPELRIKERAPDLEKKERSRARPLGDLGLDEDHLVKDIDEEDEEIPEKDLEQMRS